MNCFENKVRFEAIRGTLSPSSQVAAGRDGETVSVWFGFSGS